jgi:hypothetical protein
MNFKPTVIWLYCPLLLASAGCHHQHQTIDVSASHEQADAQDGSSSQSLVAAFASSRFTVVDDPETATTAILNIDRNQIAQLQDTLRSASEIKGFSLSKDVLLGSSLGIKKSLALVGDDDHVAALIVDLYRSPRGLFHELIRMLGAQDALGRPHGACALYINPKFAAEVNPLLKSGGVNQRLELIWPLNNSDHTIWDRTFLIPIDRSGIHPGS